MEHYSSTVELNRFASAASGKTVLITGTNEIACSTASAFANVGANVVLGDADEKAGEATVDAIAKSGGRAFFRRTDVTIWEHQIALFQFAIDMFGQIDIVLPLAAVDEDTMGFDNVFNEQGDEPTEPDLRVVKVNSEAVIFTAKLAVHHLVRSPSSQRALVFLSATSEGPDFALSPAVGATKTGIVGLHRSLMTTTPNGVRVRSVSPCVPSAPYESAPDPSRIAQTILLAATDPAPASDGSWYTVPTSKSDLSDSGLVASRIPRSTITLAAHPPYSTLYWRFTPIILIRNFLKLLVIRFYLLMRWYQ